jgi:curli production assembly/transport component CsgG
MTLLARRFVSLVSLVAFTSGCASTVFQPPVAAPPQIATRTESGKLLESLPPAKRKVVVSVYEFLDQTGQMKQNDTFAEYSRAVTQGGLAILSKALLDTSRHNWFTVIERGDLKNLLQERQIIKVTRNEYAPNDTNLGGVKPLLYAGILIEGGIVAYESNIVTGGMGAKYLGIGADMQYRRDIVTIYLRAVSSQTGEVLLSVNTSKTIYSTSVTGSAFKYVSFDKLLEAETGFTFNEPPQFAVRQAIEMGVYSLIMEGAIDGLWDFADPAAGQAAINDYLMRKDGKLPASPPAAAPQAEAMPANVAPMTIVPPAPAPQAAIQPAAQTVAPVIPQPVQAQENQAQAVTALSNQAQAIPPQTAQPEPAQVQIVQPQTIQPPASDQPIRLLPDNRYVIRTNTH